MIPLITSSFIWYTQGFNCNGHQSEQHDPLRWQTSNYNTRTIRHPPKLTLVERNCLPFWRTEVHPQVLVGFVLLTPLVVCVCFEDRCLSFCPFSFGHCVVCPSSIYGFWLPIWYIQTLLPYLSGGVKSPSYP